MGLVVSSRLTCDWSGYLRKGVWTMSTLITTMQGPLRLEVSPAFHTKLGEFYLATHEDYDAAPDSHFTVGQGDSVQDAIDDYLDCMEAGL